ncbi:unnamed protein product, partial [Iphiclides podalirius]
MRGPFFSAKSARLTCARARVRNRPVINDRPGDTDGLKDTRLTGSQPCEIQVAADRAGLMDPAACPVEGTQPKRQSTKTPCVRMIPDERRALRVPDIASERNARSTG